MTRTPMRLRAADVALVTARKSRPRKRPAAAADIKTPVIVHAPSPKRLAALKKWKRLTDRTDPDA